LYNVSYNRDIQIAKGFKEANHNMTGFKGPRDLKVNAII
jgi:hypothetical protein